MQVLRNVDDRREERDVGSIDRRKGVLTGGQDVKDAIYLARPPEGDRHHRLVLATRLGFRMGLESLVIGEIV